MTRKTTKSQYAKTRERLERYSRATLIDVMANREKTIPWEILDAVEFISIHSKTVALEKSLAKMITMLPEQYHNDSGIAAFLRGTIPGLNTSDALRMKLAKTFLAAARQREKLCAAYDALSDANKEYMAERGYEHLPLNEGGVS